MSIPMSIPSLSLEGKAAIVTGGGTGIGRAVALEFARAGASVAIAGRRAANLEKVSKEIKALGRRSLGIPTDISKKAEVENLVQRTVKEFGAVDILVNNAGIGSAIDDKNPPWLLDIPEEDWDRIVGIDLKGCYLCCQAVGKQMVERKRGSIINISSLGAFVGGSSNTPYGASKAGIIKITTGLARDLGPYNIRVNALAPGYIRTDVGVVTRQDEYAAFDDPKILENIPLRRVGEPIDIACIALFLASDASNYITGETIVMGGGPMA